MKITELNGPPPFLQGVYVRDSFDFDRCGSALSEVPAIAKPDVPPADGSAPPQLSAMMSDDDFLNSLLTPQETRPLELTPPEADQTPQEDSNRSSKEEGQLPWSLQAEQQQMARRDRFPFNFSWIEELELEFPNAVTFFVGENGSGKSTLLEAIAGMSGFPVWGGGRNDLSDQFGPEHESELAHAMYPHFKKRPRDGYFFRAEYYAQFASLLDKRKRDKEFTADPYGRYGGKSLHTRSHGESFLALLENRLSSGLFLLDEPESALSPQRQLTLLAMMVERIRKGNSQFIVATHSPILMTFPSATVISLDSPSLESIDYRDSDHFLLTKGILEQPNQYWKHLMKE